MNNMTSHALTTQQARQWAADNGIDDLPTGMRWQWCEGVQWYHETWDACYLYAGECGLYGLVGFREAVNHDMTWPVAVAEEQAS